MFTEITVAKAILEVLTVLQELNVMPCYYCAWNCSSKAGTQK